MNNRDCPNCSAFLTWGGVGVGWTGLHESWCPVAKSKARNDAAPVDPTDGVVALDTVIGPVGQPVWSVTVSLHRAAANAIGENYTEHVHVRARIYDGAILLARELFPESMIDAEAHQVTAEGEVA